MSSSIHVHDSTHQAEDDDFADGHGPKRLGEVLGVLHLSNETRDGDLSNEGVADIQKGVHATDEAGACGWNDQNDRIAGKQSGLTAVWSIVSFRMSFDTSKDGRKEDRKECKEC